MAPSGPSGSVGRSAHAAASTRAAAVARRRAGAPPEMGMWVMVLSRMVFPCWEAQENVGEEPVWYRFAPQHYGTTHSFAMGHWKQIFCYKSLVQLGKSFVFA